MSKEFDFPAEAYCVLRTLEQAGYEAYFVGGCVRDSIMGRPISDIDIATSARWEETAAVCEAAGMHAHETGVKHGTVTIVVDADEDGAVVASGELDDANAAASAPIAQPQAFEVTTYRIDSDTSADSRHPDSVEFVQSIEEDLARRDFTMNAMAWHPDRGLVDPFGGQRDIEGRVIRVVGDPSKRFKEDALRILRACRFASQLGFALDDATYEAMLTHKCLLENVSIERITHELDLMLLGAHIHDALMRTVNVIAVVLPELVAMKNCSQKTKYHCYDVLEHTAWALQEAEPTRVIRWAALCHDMGKPACKFYDANGVVHFYGHAAVSAKLARGLMDRLLMSSAFKETVVAMVLNHSDKIAGNSRSVRRALARTGGDVELFRNLLGLKRADILAHAPEYRNQVETIDAIEVELDKIIATDEAFSVKQLAITGKDVIATGIPEGPQVGDMLQQALDAVIEDELPNERDPLLEFVKASSQSCAENMSCL